MANSEGVVTAAFHQRTMQELQKIARLIVSEQSDAMTLLVSENEGKLQFVAAKGKNVTKSMKDIAAKALPLINGKGGGSDQMVQGGGDCMISKEELLLAMEKA